MFTDCSPFCRPRLSPPLQRIRRRDRGLSIPRRSLRPLTSLCPNGLRAVGARSAGSSRVGRRRRHLPAADRTLPNHGAASTTILTFPPDWRPLTRRQSLPISRCARQNSYCDHTPALTRYPQSQDATDPSSRLHAHNRNPSRARTPQSKLLPSESVLSPQELYDQQQEVQILRDNRRTKIASMTPTDMHAGDVEESLGAGGGGGGGGGPDGEDERRNERRWQSVTGELEKIALGGGASTNGRDKGVLMTASGGRPVPVISAKQWREALSIAEVKHFQGVWSFTAMLTGDHARGQIESSLTSTQRLEASASALLHHILSQRLVALPATNANSSPRPVICILSSDSDRGYIALRAAATLAYRGCRIFVLAQQQSVSSASQGASERFRTAIRVVSSAGARIVREVEGETSWGVSSSFLCAGSPFLLSFLSCRRPPANLCPRDRRSRFRRERQRAREYRVGQLAPKSLCPRARCPEWFGPRLWSVNK